MFSSASAGLRNTVSEWQRNNEVTKTLAKCQSPMMPPGISPGMATGYESSSRSVRFHKGSPRLAGLARHEQAWEWENASLDTALEADGEQWPNGQQGRNIPHNSYVLQHTNQDFLSDMFPVTAQSWESIIFALRIRNSGTRTSAVKLCPLVL